MKYLVCVRAGNRVQTFGFQTKASAMSFFKSINLGLEAIIGYPIEKEKTKVRKNGKAKKTAAKR